MTSKERIRAAVTFQPVDRVPSTIFDGGVWLTARKGISLQDMLDMEDGGASLLIDLYSQIDTDVAFVGNGLHGLYFRALGARVDYTRKGASGEVAPLLSDISEIHQLDLGAIRAQLEACPDIQKLFRQIERVRDALGREKHIASVLGAPFTLAGSMIGVQKFMELIFDEDENLPALYDYATVLTVESAKLLVEHGVDFICLGDPVASGDLISQSMFEGYALPLEKAAFEQIQGADIKLLHICGNTLPRLESLKQLPIDAFSLDSVDLKTALGIAYGHYAIFGNLSPFAVLETKAEGEVSTAAQELCRIAGKKGGFILSAGCDLTPGTSFENFKAMLDAPKLA